VNTIAALLRARADDPSPGLRFDDDTWSYQRLVGLCAQRAAYLLERKPDGAPATMPPADAAAGAAALDKLVAAEHGRFYRQPDPALWERLKSGLGALRDAAAARGTWLVVAIFPESWQVGVADPDTTPQQKLLALCRAVGVACVDLRPAFASAGGDLFQDTPHPNARGLAVAADALAGSL
jgi:hypothetical protein